MGPRCTAALRDDPDELIAPACLVLFRKALQFRIDRLVELPGLAESLNLMLGRIEQLMAGMREVSDNIAHDLKTPLNRLRNRVEEALREPPDETTYRAALERTIEEADGLMKTFNALLSIARLEAGAGGDDRDSLNLSAVVGDAAELYEPVAEERGIALNVDLACHLPVRGNRQLLGQAIANLIDNALKYGGVPAAQANGHASEVIVSTSSHDGIAEIAVSDRGPGVPEQERERVLSRFVRLEASRSEPGSGLGLSLVAAVARLHGGTVRLEDNEPGLRVVFSLPLENSAQGAKTAVRPSPGGELRPT
ncbi:MAG: HAMP domain-containing sensor histidine kinase [Methyloceanibacter sp.]